MLNFRDFIQVYVFTTNHHLKGKNLLSYEQILSFKSRPNIKELQHPMKQTRIYAR